MYTIQIYCNSKFLSRLVVYNEQHTLRYTITNITEAPISIINSLLHDSFSERLNEGINFDCATFTDQEYQQATASGIIITLWKNNDLVGTVYLNIQKRIKCIKCALHEYLAVRSDCKKSGIGSLLQEIVLEISKCMELDFLLSSTAIPATSSIRWHKKNGFIPYKISQYEGRNYKSFNFLKPLNRNSLALIFYLLSPITLFISKLIKKIK